jgi:hypothetical protein
MRSHLLLRLFFEQRLGSGCMGRWIQIKQMLRAISFKDPFTTAPVHPPLQSVKLIDSRFVDLLELMMRGSCRIQDTAELRHLPLGVSKSTLTLCGFSESSQQETLALVQFTRQKVGIVHYANCFTSLFQ